MTIDPNDEDLQAALAEAIGSDPGGIDLDDDFEISDPLDEFSGVEIDIDDLLAKAQGSLDNLLKDLALDITQPRPGHGEDVAVGFDTEYVTDEEARQHRVLSYQFHLVASQGDFSKIFYPRSGSPDHRMRLDRMLQQVIAGATEAGAIDDFPKRIHLCGFFLRLDLGTLADFSQFKNKLDNISGKLGTLKDDVPFGDHPPYLEHPPENKTYIVDDDGFPRIMKVHFLDVGSHAPQGSNLAAIGQALRLPKLDLPEGHHIERMDLLLAADKTAFEAYAIRDAEIAAKFYLRLKKLAEKVTQVGDLPATASTHAIALFRKTLKASGIDFNQVFGVEDYTPVIYDERHGHLRKGKTEKRRINRRDMYEHFVTKCYHGGRSECFVAGPTIVGLYNDYDLAGAYTTGMVDFPVIDFERPARVSRDPHDFRGYVVGFAHVSFTYPEPVRYPALPVESETHGLIYPRSGNSYCTAPEIEVALNQGCHITIHDGIIFEQVKDSPRVFEGFTTEIRRLRAQYPEGSLLEEYVKLVGNGLYGKSAQGLKAKQVFDAGQLKSVTLPPSPITFAACAAHVTGFVRAVMSEILHHIPEHRTVVSATTDGFLTDATKDELHLDGPMAQRFAALCHRVEPGKSMLKCKHQGEQILAMKTRGQLTAAAFEDKPIILAKGSVSPPLKRQRDMSADQFKALQNEYMVNLYLDRAPGQRTEIRPFVSLRDQMTRDWDVIRLSRSVRLNLEFDFKRRPTNPVMHPVVGREHLAFDTEPWEEVAEMDVAREIFDEWKKANCLKTLEDWNNWQDFYQPRKTLKSARRQGKVVGMNVTKEGATGVLLRTFLRAYTRELWGLRKTMSYPALANLLTEKGYPTTKDDISNANRAKHGPAEGCCARTPETEALAGLLKEIFPQLEIEKFFPPEE